MTADENAKQPTIDQQFQPPPLAASIAAQVITAVPPSFGIGGSPPRGYVADDGYSTYADSPSGGTLSGATEESEDTPMDRKKPVKTTALATAAARSAASSVGTSSNGVTKHHLKQRTIGPIATVSRDQEEELNQTVDSSSSAERDLGAEADTLALAFQFAGPGQAAT